MVARITQVASEQYNLYFNEISTSLPSESAIKKTVEATRERLQTHYVIADCIEKGDDRIVLQSLPTESKYFNKEGYKYFMRVILDNEETHFIQCTKCQHVTWSKNREGSCWYHECDRKLFVLETLAIIFFLPFS